MFWKKKKPDSSINVMEGIKKAADAIRKELKEPAKKRQPNPLWELVIKAKSHEDLEQLAETYQDSADVFFDLVLILRTLQLDMNILDRNINILDERVSALEKKPEKKEEKD